jgi:RNA polymerase sigma-70 factor, ECF subfamily
MDRNRPPAEPAEADQTCDKRDSPICADVKMVTVPGAASEALFRAHSQAVFAICLANTQNYHDAEDIMQAVFLKSIAKASSVREPARVRAWLFQVARRLCVDFHRKRKPAEPLLTDPPTSPVCDTAPYQRLHEAIQKLPQDYRETIVLYYLDGRKCSSVADSLGIAEPAVRQRLVRARAMLHDLLREERP